MSELVFTAGQIPPAGKVVAADGSVSYAATKVVIPCSWDASTLYLSSDDATASRVLVMVRTAPNGIWSQVGGQTGVLVSPSDTNHTDLGPVVNGNTWVIQRIPNGPGDTMQGGLGYELRQTVSP